MSRYIVTLIFLFKIIYFIKLLGVSASSNQSIQEAPLVVNAKKVPNAEATVANNLIHTSFSFINKIFKA